MQLPRNTAEEDRHFFGKAWTKVALYRVAAMEGGEFVPGFLSSISASRLFLGELFGQFVESLFHRRAFQGEPHFLALGALTWGHGLAYPVLMQPEIREFLDHARFHAAAMRELSGMLPSDDAELDRMIETAVRENDLKTFMFVVVAALQRERKVEARHLAHGVGLIPDGIWMGALAFHMEGDVAEHLMEGLRQRRVLRDEAVAVFVVAAWCQEHRGGVLPEGLMTQARLQARMKELDYNSFTLLLAVGLQANDEGLQQILRARADGFAKLPDGTLVCRRGGRGVDEKTWQEWQDAAREKAKTFLGIYRGPVADCVRPEPESTRVSATPMQRAVARVGRNERCPCGSGKKYKHCCLEKDHERLLRSSSVAGRTEEELQAEPEPHLTRNWIENCNPYEMARFNPTKIAPALWPAYFDRLNGLRQYERATEAFEQLGFSEALKESWERTFVLATQYGHTELLRRLLALRPDRAAVDKEMPMPSALLLAEPEVARILQILDDETMKVLKGTVNDLHNYALGLLYSRFRGLGILVARGVIPFLSGTDAANLFDASLYVRDCLKLPPNDPGEDIIDRLFLDLRMDDGKEAAALREAQRKLGEKVREVGRLKESLQQMQRELEKREQTAQVSVSVLVPAGPVSSPAPAGEDPTLKELRGKVEALKSALKERHGERNELRRELQKAHTDLDELRQKSAPSAPIGNGHEADQEEDWLLPQESPQTQPVRVIEFPKHFQESLASLPKSVARGTLTMLGRLAAGEPAAFVGAVRLKACPSIMRHRIGIDFRLLFRLLPDCVQVVDLIPRQDLERKIKTLV